MKRTFFLVAVALMGCVYGTRAQSTAYVLGGGATVGTQRWDGSFDRQPMLQWHGTLGIETVNNEDDRSSLFAQLGYHVKGSAIRLRFISVGGNNAFQTVDRFKFNNVSLILGAKQKYALGEGNSKYYYFGGIRADYTVSTNLEELREENNAAANPYVTVLYPFPQYVNKFIGGVSVGGGLELPLSELVGAEVKFSLHPDFTLQYNQPPIPNVIINDPFNPGQSRTIPERRIRNVTLELSVALRLLRKVVLVD